MDWTDLDRRAVDNARVLAMDAVQAAGSGHPGTAMSLAPVAYLLYHKLMRLDPSDSRWPGRDRFVLSCGHTSLTQYVQLYLSGYDLPLEQLKQYRKWGSLTPGHPEVEHTDGIEVTTGPLGQGLANAVGMAMSARRERGLLDPDAAPGQGVFDHTVWVIASDGDIEEGVTSEASSLAGVQQLGNLVVIYDQNRISIEDDTADRPRRGHGEAVRGLRLARADRRLDGRRGPDGRQGREVHRGRPGASTTRSSPRGTRRRRPSLIVLKTDPGLAGAERAEHRQGARLGARRGGGPQATKQVLGFDPDQHFEVDEQALARAREVVERGRQLHAEWDERFAKWKADNPDRFELWDRLRERRLPAGWQDKLPTFEAGKAVASRKASSDVLNALKDVLPELWGGSADLAESNNTTMEGEPSFLPTTIDTKLWGQGNPYGRILHFGIREHAMGSIMNGIALHGGLRVYGGTFLVFSDYMRPAVRLAAIQKLPVTYVWTHDSIGLGEDGPTHQPVEHLAALRAIPNLDVVRPADANETAWAWRTDARAHRPPAGLCLSAVRTCPRSTAPPPAASPRPTASPRAPTSCRRRTAASRR